MYLLNNFINTIKTGLISKRKIVIVRNTKLIYKIVNILYKEGLIYGFYYKNNNIFIELKFFENEPLIIDLKLISKPGKRIYMSSSSIEKKYNNKFLIIVSTSSGVLTHKDAILQNKGGELLLEISI